MNERMSAILKKDQGAISHGTNQWDVQKCHNIAHSHVLKTAEIKIWHDFHRWKYIGVGLITVPSKMGTPPIYFTAFLQKQTN